MTSRVQVPFLDLAAKHGPLKDELFEAISRVIESGAFSGGPFVSGFEADFADFCGTRHAVGVGSGTDALWLALAALGIGPGDEVITVPMTFVATVEAICRTGATPVFVDIDPETYNLDPTGLRRAWSPRTKAIVPVHLFGRMAEMDDILAFAEDHGLVVVEDAAQAHGAEYRGRRAGSLGHAGCFSFYPGKNLGAFGEAGAVVTDDAELAAKMKVLRDHGQSRRYVHSMVGWNCRMDGIQAAVLQIKLGGLDAGNERRREHAAFYRSALEGLPDVICPAKAPAHAHVHHLFALQVRDRQGFMEGLRFRGIDAAIHYPVPLHLQEAYACLGHGRGAFPVAEQCAERFVSIPIYPELTRAQLGAVTGAVIEASGAGLTI